MSADPLAVHVPGEADFNLYAYVSGMALTAIDPIGLDSTTFLARRAIQEAARRGAQSPNPFARAVAVAAVAGVAVGDWAGEKIWGPQIERDKKEIKRLKEQIRRTEQERVKVEEKIRALDTEEKELQAKFKESGTAKKSRSRAAPKGSGTRKRDPPEQPDDDAGGPPEPKTSKKSKKYYTSKESKQQQYQELTEAQARDHEAIANTGRSRTNADHELAKEGYKDRTPDAGSPDASRNDSGTDGSKD